MASFMGRPARRDQPLVAYVRRELYPHSAAAHARIDAAGLAGGQVRSAADLAKIPAVDLDEVGDGTDYVLRPTRAGLVHAGGAFMRLRTLWASTWGRWNAFLSAIEPLYRPVHYFSADTVPVGAAAADLVRLAGLGAAWLGELGISRADTVALVGGASSNLEAWELSGGTRRGGVSLAVLDDATAAARHQVSVLAGTEDAVVEGLASGAWPRLRLVLVLGPSAEVVEKRLAGLGAADSVAVRRAWAVPGTRSVWYECRGGAEYGWHTTPAAEWIEIDDHDEILWTGIGWAGTVFLRLRTDVRAARVEATVCSACGHVGLRLFVAEGRPALARWLHADPRVADWRLTAQGAHVLPVRAGANARLVKEAKQQFPDHDLTVHTKKSWSAS